MPHLTPTDEQIAALDLFTNGDTFVIEAGAGTGKSSTLRMLAESAPVRTGLYCAFNKAVVTDAQHSMPRNVNARTFHSLAFATHGVQHKHRFNARRRRSDTIARALGINQIVVRTQAGEKRLTASFLGGQVLRALKVFCTTADPAPSVMHFPYIEGIDLPDSAGNRTYEQNNLIARTLLEALQDAWEDAQDPDGDIVPFEQGYYLKMWQLSKPRLGFDFLMVDEAQDLAAVVADVMLNQTHIQQVFVGDSQQAIYGFIGANNAMEKLDTDNRTYLTRSFRFGPEIADVANAVLARLDAPLRVTGAGPNGTVATSTDPDVVLARSNAMCVRRALDEITSGGKPAIVGGADDVIRFARGAADLHDTGRSNHPDLSCFKSWDEVLDYVSHDPNGSELALLTRLVEDFGYDQIIDGLSACVAPENASIVLSTAHKSKGREWSDVQIADDFPTGVDDTGTKVEVPDEELRLLYVAATRAKRNLDTGSNPLLRGRR